MSLIKRDWILYKKYYYLAAIILIAICIFVMLLISDEANVNTPPDAPEIIFGVMLFSIGTIYTLRSFREFKRSSDSVTYLLIPASHIDKWLSRWIITLPLFLIISSMIFFISYFILSYIALATFNVRFTPIADIRWSYFLQHYSSFVFFHSVFFFFAVLFKSNTILKSVLVFVILWLVFVFFSYYINNGSVQADDSFKTLITSNYRYLMFFAVPIFWVLSYNRFKSKFV